MALDIETTGSDPDKHEIWQLAIIVLNSQLKTHRDAIPFNVVIRPDREDTIDRSVMRITRDGLRMLMKHTVDHEQAREWFSDWLQGLRHSGLLAQNRSLCVLSQNWPALDRPFLTRWIGLERYEEIFHPWYRDPMAIAMFVNDVNYHNSDAFDQRRAIFPKAGQSMLGSLLGVPNDNPHQAMADAEQLAEIYRRMVIGFANGPDGMIKRTAEDLQ